MGTHFSTSESRTFSDDTHPQTVLPRDGTWKGGRVAPDSREPWLLMPNQNHKEPPQFMRGAEGGGWMGQSLSPLKITILSRLFRTVREGVTFHSSALKVAL